MAIVRTYLGHMPQLRTTSVSYKNHKTYRKDQSERAIVYNTHEPIISQELWDKVHGRMKSVAQGKRTKRGHAYPLSEFLFCADCGGKMKLHYITKNRVLEYSLTAPIICDWRKYIAFRIT